MRFLLQEFPRVFFGATASLEKSREIRKNRDEIGATLKNQHPIISAADPEIYNDAIKEIGHLESQTKPYVPLKTVAETRHQYKTEPSRKPVKRTVFKPTVAPNKGLITKILDKVTGEAAYCIRCGKAMPEFDLQKPYCDKCYASWARYKNPTYKEKYCHGCGNDNTHSVISYEKPTCKGCYTEYYKR